MLLTRLKSLLKRPPQEARLPADQRIYAIGDVHGRIDLLAPLLDHIRADASQAGAEQLTNTLVFLGDYVDRGPSSKAVLDLLLSLNWPGWKIVRLRGNHEQSLLDFLSDPEAYREWRNYGAADTLWSYGVKPPSFSDRKEIEAAQQQFRAALPLGHQAFLMDLAFSYSVGGYYFVHAGIRPGIPLKHQVPGDQLWIRDDFLLSDARFEKVVVHGHTPAAEPVVRPNRIGIDTGAYATNRLSAVCLAGDDMRILSARC